MSVDYRTVEAVQGLLGNADVNNDGMTTLEERTRSQGRRGRRQGTARPPRAQRRSKSSQKLITQQTR